MAEQDPANINNDKFTVTPKDGVTPPTNILASLQNSENQTITHNSPTSSTLPHTHDDAMINAEAVPSSILNTSEDTVTPPDTALNPSSTAHDVNMSSMRPPTPDTLDSDRASTIANSNQASESMSQLPDLGVKPASRSHRKSSSVNISGSEDQGLSYELGKANDEIETLEQKLKEAESTNISLKHELDTGKTEIANDEIKSLKRQLAEAESTIASLNPEFDEVLRDEIRFLKHENATLEHEIITNLKHEITTLKQENATREHEIITNLKQEITTLKHELDTEEKEVHKLKLVVQRQNREKSGLDVKVVALTAAGSSLRMQVSADEHTIKQLNKEVKKLEKKLIDKEKDQRLGNNDELEGLQAVIEDQRKELESKDVLLNERQQEVREKDGNINYANAENERLVKQIQTLEQNRKTQTGQVKGVSKKWEDSKMEITRLNKEHDKIIKELQQSIATLTMRVEKQPKDRLFEMKAEFAATLEANARIESELETLRTEMSGLEAELNKTQIRADKAQEKLRKWVANIKDTKKEETAGEKIETPGEQEGGAADQVETIGEKIKIPHETPIEQEGGATDKVETSGEKIKIRPETPVKEEEGATDKVDTTGEKTEIPLDTAVKHVEGATNMPTVEHLAGSVNNEPDVTVSQEPKLPSADVEAKEQGSKSDVSKVDTTGEKIEVPLEIPVEQVEGATDVPFVEHIAESLSNEPGVTVSQEPKLPSADVEAKEQGLKADVSELTEPQWQNGQTSEATEAGAVINANALEKAEDQHKEDSWRKQPFTRALTRFEDRHKEESRDTDPFSKALERAQDHRKEESQGADPFTEAHVYLEPPTTPRDREHDDSSSVCSTTELSIDDRTPRALRRTLGQEGIQSRAQSTATDLSVVKCDEWVQRTNIYVGTGVQTEDVPAKLMANKGVQAEDLPVKLPNGGELSPEEDQSKGKSPEPHQFRWGCNMPNFLFVLMLLLYLTICYLKWSSWAATRAERNLWITTNSAQTHGALLHQHGGWPPSALDDCFRHKM